jgi:protoporphyrinogen oxidase
LDGPLSDTYWLNVADPGFPFGGVIEHTNLVPSSNYAGRHLVYLSRYFEQSNPLATATEAAIADEMTAALPRIYPHFAQRRILSRHVFRTQTAATVCDLNFSAKVPSMQTSIPGLYIASMAHVYPDERSLNNSLRVAAEVCRVIGIPTFAEVPHGSSLSGRIGSR